MQIVGSKVAVSTNDALSLRRAFVCVGAEGPCLRCVTAGLLFGFAAHQSRGMGIAVRLLEVSCPKHLSHSFRNVLELECFFVVS